MQDNELHYLEEPLPDWAASLVIPELPPEINTVYATKDGRYCGNAILVDRNIKPHLGVVYTTITDAGNVVRLTANELEELFHPPKWVAKAPMKHLEEIITNLKEGRECD